MEKDFCVRCGSHNIKTMAKELRFELKNPGEIIIEQEGDVCQECDETYFSQKQMEEMSEKFNKEKKKLEGTK